MFAPLLLCAFLFFNPKICSQEMELLTCGLPDIDVEDMRAHTEYRGYSDSHPVVQWFWQVWWCSWSLRDDPSPSPGLVEQVVFELDHEERALLLQFITGTSRVPLGGFAALQGMHGPQRLALQAAPPGDHRLPAAHTWSAVFFMCVFWLNASPSASTSSICPPILVAAFFRKSCCMHCIKDRKDSASSKIKTEARYKVVLSH